MTAELVPEESQLVADGRNAPVIAVRLKDRFGRLVREGVTGFYTVDTPYQSRQAVENLRTADFEVSHIHLRHLWPLPPNLSDLLAGFDHVLVPEMNTGQLRTILRAEYLIPAEGLNKVTGQPFRIAEIEAAACRLAES